tara:strand:- start:1051 stop:1692 length:642 start_codon:yes stop_codon:yes gene_type:complete
MTEKKVLIACEYSGIVRNAFLDQGFDTWSCDLLPSDDKSNRHIQDDIRYVMKADNWDLMMVAHPPCTRLCNSGVRWLSKPPKGKTLKQMWEDLDQGAKLFSDLWNADIPRVAVENPVMHKYAKERITNYEPFTQSFQPWQFGDDVDGADNVKKRTCLWLRNLPPLNPTGSLDGTTARNDIHNCPPSKDRWKIRSTFFHGVADAMANQWGEVIR